MNQEYDLTEPVKAYEYFLKDAVHETASNFFDGLVNKNNIDINATALTVKDVWATPTKMVADVSLV